MALKLPAQERREKTPIAESRVVRGMRQLKAMAVNRRDLGSSRQWHPLLRGYDAGRIDSALSAAYHEYIATVSNAEHAMSLETANLMQFLLARRRPAVALDLGSGSSSYVIRAHERRTTSTGGVCEVFSCDDAVAWRGRTHAFLEAHGLSVSHLMLWQEYRALEAQERPGFIFYDLGSIATRIEELPAVLDLCADDTLVLVDDVHKSRLRVAVLDQIRKRSLKCSDLTRYTYDAWGRYAWIVWRGPA